ncbi:uncharacterized protein ARMOST_20727 [Armillaria ostoyae]|uniref:C2H2-type domain-containing protein n=1 Tax=Armillaria ostoyae TaxID=47428 RepID=A0A284S831_ARMOS|nr:uncharacterized protein ARMOST_20727 [Armillaria ostoyae]
MTNTVSLPGIYEIFPEHLLRTLPEVRRVPSTLIPPSGYARPPIIINHSQYSISVLRPDPASDSRKDIHSAAFLPYRPQSFLRSRRQSTPTSSEEGEDLPGEHDRKHICTLCNKRFNRPSSLRTHVNTHTGATPFQCPFPRCGRSFNVNSNMRRHYRNHTNSSYASLVPAPSSSSPSHTFSSSAPHSSLPYHKHQINVSEYVWYPPPSSITSSDDEEQPTYKSRPSLESHYRRGYEKFHKEIHFDRHRVSDVRTTRVADHHTVAEPAVYSYRL